MFQHHATLVTDTNEQRSTQADACGLRDDVDRIFELYPIQRAEYVAWWKHCASPWATDPNESLKQWILEQRRLKGSSNLLLQVTNPPALETTPRLAAGAPSLG